MAKKEFTVRYLKTVNDAWCGTAYFINPTLGKRTAYTAAAGPHEKRTTSVAWINERLNEYVEELRTVHSDWNRVEEEEFHNFPTKIKKIVA